MAKATHCAYCWSSGLIGFCRVDENPEGTIEIARGPKESLRRAIETVARHGKEASKGKLLVPGVPEAPDQQAAADALAEFLTWCNSGSRHPTVTFSKEVK